MAGVGGSSYRPRVSNGQGRGEQAWLSCPGQWQSREWRGWGQWACLCVSHESRTLSKGVFHGRSQRAHHTSRLSRMHWQQRRWGCSVLWAREASRRDHSWAHSNPWGWWSPEVQGPMVKPSGQKPGDHSNHRDWQGVFPIGSVKMVTRSWYP